LYLADLKKKIDFPPKVRNKNHKGFTSYCLAVVAFMRELFRKSLSGCLTPVSWNIPLPPQGPTVITEPGRGSSFLLLRVAVDRNSHLGFW
jgi:hypothetical protein